MYGCESWSVKKAEHRGIDDSELWFWRRLESSLECKIKSVSPKGNQSWIFIGRTDAKSEAPILWPPDVQSWLIRKDLDAGKGWWQEEKAMRGWDGWMASPTQWMWVWVDSGSWWWTGLDWHAAVYGVAKSQTQLSDWPTTKVLFPKFFFFFLSLSLMNTVFQVWCDLDNFSLWLFVNSAQLQVLQESLDLCRI